MSHQIDRLVEQVRASPDPQTRDTALQLAQAILDLHAGALERLMELVSVSEDGDRWMEALGQDPKIGGVLLLHDLHPLDLEERVRRALANPELRNGAAQIVLASAEDGVIRVRVEGPRGLRADVERAIWEAAPDAQQVIVDGGEELTPAGFVPIEALLAGSP